MASQDKFSRVKVLLTLFWEMFKISLFVVGGGLAIAAVADEVFSRRRKWIREGEIVDSLPVVQMVPGLIAGNVAVYIGRKVAGFLGSVVAVVAVALPSIAIFLCVSAGYESIPADNRVVAGVFSALRSSLTGIVVATILRSWKKCVGGVIGCATAAAAAVALFMKCNPALIVFLAGAFSILCEYASPASDGKGRRRFLSPPILTVALLFLEYGSLAFGGGYVLVPFYLHDFVGAGAPYIQMPAEEFSNLIALTQLTPGPIAINAATFFGYRMSSFAGSLAASFSILLPGFVLMHLMLSSLDRFSASRFVKALMRGIRPVTVAMMAGAAWSFASMSVFGDGFSFHPFAFTVAVLSAFAMHTRKLAVTKIIAASAAAGAAVEAIAMLVAR